MIDGFLSLTQIIVGKEPRHGDMEGVSSEIILCKIVNAYPSSETKSL